MAYFYGPTEAPDWLEDKVNRNTLRALTQLPDSFHVLVEFSIPQFRNRGRMASPQLDFLVVEADRPLKMIVIEEKTISSPILEAGPNGPWKILKRGRVVPHSTGDNPFQQTMRIADTTQDWMRANAERILGAPPAEPASSTIRVYRTLFLRTHGDSVHLKPPQFLNVIRDPDRLVSDLMGLDPRRTENVLIRAGVRRLIDAIGGLSPKRSINSVQLGTPGDAWEKAADEGELDALRLVVEALTARVDALERRLPALSTRPEERPPPMGPAPRSKEPAPIASPPPTTADATPELTARLVEVLRTLGGAATLVRFGSAADHAIDDLSNRLRAAVRSKRSPLRRFIDARPQTFAVFVREGIHWVRLRAATAAPEAGASSAGRPETPPPEDDEGARQAARARLERLLKEAGSRPLPDERKWVIERICSDLGELDAPVLLTALKPVWSAELNISRKRITHILRALVHGGAFIDANGQRVEHLLDPVSGLIDPEPAALETRCLAAYHGAVIARDPALARTPEFAAIFEEHTGGPLPSEAAPQVRIAHAPPSWPIATERSAAGDGEWGFVQRLLEADGWMPTPLDDSRLPRDLARRLEQSNSRPVVLDTQPPIAVAALERAGRPLVQLVELLKGETLCPADMPLARLLRQRGVDPLRRHRADIMGVVEELLARGPLALPELREAVAARLGLSKGKVQHMANVLFRSRQLQSETPGVPVESAAEPAVGLFGDHEATDTACRNYYAVTILRYDPTRLTTPADRRAFEVCVGGPPSETLDELRRRAASIVTRRYTQIISDHTC